MTSEPLRTINSEITSQVSGKIGEFKVYLYLQIRETIKQVISDQVLPIIRETSGEISSGARPNVDIPSSARHRSPETHCRKKAWRNIPNLNKSISNQDRHKIENSLEPHSSDEEYDMVTGANLTPHTVPEFITGRLLHPQENLPNSAQTDSPKAGRTICPGSNRSKHIS